MLVQVDLVLATFAFFDERVNNIDEHPSVEGGVMLLAVPQRSHLPITHLLVLAKLLFEQSDADHGEGAAALLLEVWIHSLVKILSIHEVWYVVEELHLSAVFFEHAQVSLETKPNYGRFLVRKYLAQHFVKFEFVSQGHDVN